MAVISKELFYRRIDQNVHCRQLHLWQPNCLKATILSPILVSNVAKGTAKFFFPIYLLKLALNHKKIRDKDFIIKLLMEEATSVIYGTFFATSLISSICVLRKLFGRIHYYNLVLVPSMMSGISLLIETKENQVLDTLIFFNAFVETVLKNIHISLFAITKTRETLMFMVVSAILMYLLSNRRKKFNTIYFWFYTPPRRKDDNVSEETKMSNHGIYNWQFWKDSFMKYFALGYAVNMVRRTFSKVGILTKKPHEVFKILFNKSNVKFGLFIGGYVAAYRIMTYYLLKWGKIRKKFHGLVAGFLSGLTYAISPNIQVLVVGITTILQILYSRVSEKVNIKNHFWLRQSLFMFCNGFLMHMKFCYPDSCSPYYKNMVDACTNNFTSRVYEALLSKYFPENTKGEHMNLFLD